MAVIGGVLIVGVIGLIVHPTTGYPKYRSSSDGWCVSCHGDFNGPSSPTGAVFPYDSKHLMHRASSEMNTSCDMCHYAGDDLNPDLNFSDDDGFGGGPGYGCAGCHARDYGGEFGVIAAGLRAKHRAVSISCGDSSCHSNDPDPLPENVPPPYYGSFETRAWDPCNRLLDLWGENFSIEQTTIRGLDNDGDGLYDLDDPDCAVETCAGDCGETNGEVDIVDFLAVLASWGQQNVPCDLNGDGVGIDDFLEVLAFWGPCP
jgi:hypothetical protein